MPTHHTYGLELTENSKVGWAFSLSRRHSCINATEICKSLCYGNGFRYHSEAQIEKRLRNFRTLEFLLDKGGPELLACNLVALADQARPSDWLAAELSGEPTHVPWGLRIHDVGDYHSLRYAQAWLIAVRQRPKCSFWFYTRSFVEPDLLAVLSELAALENCSGLLSIDTDNFNEGLRAFASYPGIWKLALLQQDEALLPPELMPAIKANVRAGEIINFPYHQGSRHTKPLVAAPLTNCPQLTTKSLPLQKSRSLPKPCQICSLCLPS